MALILLSKIILAIINVSAVLLALWVWLADRQAKLNRWFGVMTAFIILWVDFAFLGNTTNSHLLATTFYRLNWVMVILFLISSFYFYVVNFLKINHLILRKVVLAIGLALIVFSLFSSLIIQDVIKKPWGNEIVFGWMNNLVNLYAFVVALIVVGSLIKKYAGFSKEEKLKVQYFLIGTFLFAFSNVIFNIVLPAFKGTVAYQYFGDHSAIFLLGFTALAIIKHKLFGIKVIFTQILTVAMSITLLILPFLVDILWFKIILFAVFAVSCFFGYLITKSAVQDAKQKEILEKMVAERTKDLQNTLNELKIKKDELEKFYRLTVGRELKMVELKEKIKHLEDQAFQKETMI